MQFRKLFDFKNISRFITLAIVIFLFLPLIFPEKNEFKIINKESVYSREESPLPVFPKENLLDKYVNKLKKFYKMDVPVFASAKQNNEQEKTLFLTPEEKIRKSKENAKENIDINAEDLFFSAYLNDDEIEINTAQAEQQDNSVNLQKGTVLTKDGLVLEPTKDGYYYKGKFYKNGTYPQNANRNLIEGALNRYHSRIAKNLGKKALYFADEQGNLTVSYVDELPSEISTDIDTYLAQNPVQPSNNLKQETSYYNSHSDKKQYDKYQNAKINSKGQDFVDTADIALASIRSMHAAYNLMHTKIKEGQLGQGLIPNPNNLIPLGNIILNQTAIAEPPIENPENSIYCQGDECKNSYRIAPLIANDEYGVQSSDLDLFYSSLCNEDKEKIQEGEQNCPYTFAYNDNSNNDKPFNLDITNKDNLELLKEDLSNSDKKIVEITYIHPNKENEELLSSLQEMSLTNKDGETVEIKLRGFEAIQDNASFGDKIVGPFKSNITKDLASENNEISYKALVNKYNKVNEETQTKINETIDNLYYKELYPDLNLNLPTAFVEKDTEDGYFIINNSEIPKGYISEIPQWAKYKQENGSYKVPKNILFNPPADLAIIAVQNEKNRDIVLQDGHPIGVISKENLQNRNFKNVSSNLLYIANIQINTIKHNADKAVQEQN